jgi:hypothetical protein
MIRFFAFIMVLVATMLLVGCGASSAPSTAPTNVKAVVGDGVITLTWDGPDVPYFVWGAQGNSVTVGCNSNCTTVQNASSPWVITSVPLLINGVEAAQQLFNNLPYSFTINVAPNGTTPGGPGSPSVTATPRLAGGAGTWSVGNPLSTQDLHGVAYGVPSLPSAIFPGFGFFVAAGTNGALFSGIVSSADGSLTWTQSNNSPTTENLNAVTYNGGRFLAVGSGGTILLSTDGATWTKETSGIQNDLHAVSNWGAGFIAVGANGTIITSGDGINWGGVTSPTLNDLYGITYGVAYNTYVAVGAKGTLITSTNGTTWGNVTPTPSTASDLKGVAYGLPSPSYVLPLSSYGYILPVGTFVAVGANGTQVTSQDGVTWTTQKSISSSTLNAVTFGHQFVAVDNLGSTFTSTFTGTNTSNEGITCTDGITCTNGITWQSAHISSNPLYAVIPATYTAGSPYANLFVYSAVGATGANLLSR